jgi:GNAT superfamily N-acetyltransferase
VQPESVTKADFDEIVDRLAAFWGERDLSAMHHPMFVHEFGDSAFLIRDEHGKVAAYLFGFVVPAQALAYVHLVGVRSDQRGRGFARTLYEHFQRLARERGCDRIKGDHDTRQHRFDRLPPRGRNGRGRGSRLRRNRTWAHRVQRAPQKVTPRTSGPRDEVTAGTL